MATQTHPIIRRDGSRSVGIFVDIRGVSPDVEISEVLVLRVVLALAEPCMFLARMIGYEVQNHLQTYEAWYAFGVYSAFFGGRLNKTKTLARVGK